MEIWEAKDKNDREEALDLWRYALASVRFQKINWTKYSEAIAKLITEAKEKAAEPAKAEEEEKKTPVTDRLRKKKGWDVF